MICEICGLEIRDDEKRIDVLKWHTSTRTCVSRLQELLASSREDAEVWQGTLEDIIEETGIISSSSIAAMAMDGVKLVMRENARLRLALRNKLGDDLCWMDGIEVQPLPKDQMMESCSRYIDQMLSGKGPLCAGQMTIAQLEARIVELEEQVRTMGNTGPDHPQKRETVQDPLPPGVGQEG